MEFAGNRSLMGVIAVLLLLFVAAVFFYNRTLNDLAAGSCTDSSSNCPHEKIVETQNLVIAALILVIGIMAAWIGYSTYVKKPEAAAPANAEKSETPETASAPRARKKRLTATNLEPDEAQAVAIINEAGGSVFQSDIIRKTGFSKVKVSRIIDRLEQKGLVERKRRGMTNLVVAK